MKVSTIALLSVVDRVLARLTPADPIWNELRDAADVVRRDEQLHLRQSVETAQAEARRSEPDRARRSAGPQADQDQAVLLDHLDKAREAIAIAQQWADKWRARAIALKAEAATVRRDTLRKAADTYDYEKRTRDMYDVDVGAWLRQRAEDV